MGRDHLWLTTRADYALRALTELAREQRPLTAETIAAAQDIPRAFLSVILGQLRHAGLVRSRRGRIGGYTLARTPDAITVAEVVRAVDEPSSVASGENAAEPALAATYQVLRGSLLGLLETVSLEGLMRGRVPAEVRRLAGLASRTPRPR